MLTIGFDLDDTLYFKIHPLEQSFLELNLVNEIQFEEFLKVFQKYSDIGFEYFTKQTMTLKESHIFRIKETLNEFGVEMSDNEAATFQAIYEDNQQKIKPIPEIIEILDYLKNKKIQTIIITNGPSESQRKKLVNLGLTHYFSENRIIVSGEEAIAKPDPKLFQIAEKRFQIDRDKAWYIGDSYENDVIGANNAGWNSIWIDHNKKLESKRVNIATLNVTSEDKLKALIFNKF